MTTPNAPTLLDELLSGLIDDADDIGPPVADVDVSRGAPALRAAPLTQTSVDKRAGPTDLVETALPGTVIVPMADARARKEARAQMADEALAISLGTLRVIKRAFDENGADFDDALRALPLVHRVLEHVDKMDVARDTAKVFAPLIFSIVMDDNVPQVPPPNRVKPLTPLAVDVADQVIDVTP